MLKESGTLKEDTKSMRVSWRPIGERKRNSEPDIQASK